MVREYNEDGVFVLSKTINNDKPESKGKRRWEQTYEYRNGKKIKHTSKEFNEKNILEEMEEEFYDEIKGDYIMKL